MADTKVDAISPDHFSTDTDKPVLSVLSHLACYEVSGEDAQTFLQSQFTNDISEVENERAQLSSYCTPKGRMLAIFYVVMRDNKYLLITSKDLSNEVMKRLQMFVMRSQVTINKLDDLVTLGLSQDANNIVLEQMNLPAPTHNYHTTSNGNHVCINIPGIESRYLIIADQDLLTKVDKESCYIYTYEYWQWLDTLAGIPFINADTQEAFVPQMANMELINGVSFSKGCYPGQEVVARLHYLGNANRRMFRVDTVSEKELHAGDEIFSSSSEQAIGKFLTVTKTGNNQYHGLAVLRVDAAKQADLSTAATQGQTVNIMNLPYDVPTDAKQKSD